MLLLTLYLFLPTAVCAFWIVVHLLTASRTDSFKYFVYLFACCALYIYSEACHALFANNLAVDTVATLIGQLAGPSIVPFLILYLGRLTNLPRKEPIRYIWIVVPIVLFTVGALLFFMRGVEKADELYTFFTVKVYNTVLTVNLVVIFLYTLRFLLSRKNLQGTFWRFLFRKGRISLAKMQLNVALIPMSVMAMRVFFTENLYTLSRTISLTTASLLLLSAFLFGLMALFGTRPSIQLKDLRYLLRFNYSADNKAEAVEQMMNDLLDEAEEEALRRIQEKIGANLHIEQWKSEENTEESHILANQIFSAVSDSWDENSLISRFQHLMMDEQLFLKPKLSLDDVAERLHSNKTYVSKLVNNTYNLGFPELINILRIDYAEQYIMSHREAKQEEIAQECGFLSASSFNTIFKKVTGMTPKVWISTIDRQKNND